MDTCSRMGVFEETCLAHIRSAVSVATGCTEPVAIALCAAAAREASTGAPEEITVRLDMGLYKNALGVVVLGVNKRSVVLCAALGAAAGKTSDGMNIFASMGPAEWKKAEALVPITHVTVAAEARSLYAEATIRTRQSHVRAVIKETHDRISKIEAYPFSKDNFQLPAPNAFLRSLTLRHMLAFAQNIPGGRLDFLDETVEINRSLMKKGLEMGYGKAAAYLEAADSAAARAQLAVGAASWARMAGVPLPAATATGSGNQGITLSLTIDAAALFFNSTKEQMLRALALGHLVNLLAKSYIGSLAPVCSSGIASGAGAAAAVAWLLGGTEAAILGSIQNMLGGIGGMLCDGAKEGCAHKAALAAYAAVTAAYLSIAGCHVAARDGVCSGDIHGLFENMRRVIFDGMGSTNETLLSVMTQKQTIL